MKPTLMSLMLAAGLVALTGCGSSSNKQGSKEPVVDTPTVDQPSVDDKTPARFSRVTLELIGTSVSGQEFDTPSSDKVS